MSNPLLLNYHDAVLYQSDLNILESPRVWLNDACMNFVLTRLGKEFASRCRFVDPSVLSFFMHQWDEEEDGDEDVLGLKRPQDDGSTLFLFLPINDNYVSQNWTNPGGGTHWSLLLLAMEKKKDGSQFWHFDSSAGSNQRAALAVAQKIQRVMNHHPKHPMEECTAPQQQNGYDCGLHTLATARALAMAFSSGEENKFRKDTLEDIVRQTVATSPSFFSKMRQAMVQDIQSLIQEDS
ncbi:Sentrin-specific protease 8 [Seminavis robusta]|uniref:Sentrin-specific protease 8 n=1 Tax=Seminavis robusta TaxID=568900 RepID=A0A9N8DKJ0_9STRA|nr:Sentrin-specific protease 8 [Seminavis robusta]|eukprot:Sro209_g087290.1 Sentrin-specific protease 8 (237) ;mRNA; f:27138-27848